MKIYYISDPSAEPADYAEKVQSVQDSGRRVPLACRRDHVAIILLLMFFFFAPVRSARLPQLELKTTLLPW